MTIIPGRVVPATRAAEDTEDFANLRGVVFLCYALFAVSVLTGISGLIGVVVAYVKRGEAAGTIWQSHFDNMITVFWVMLAGVLLGFLTWPIALGAFIAHQTLLWPWPAFALPVLFALVLYPLLLVWFLYRIVRGFVRASAEQPY